MKQKSRSTRGPLPRLATSALILALSIGCVYAQPDSAVSGTAAASTISLQAGTPTSEYQLAGTAPGAGAFTVRVVSASAPAPAPSSCSGPMKLYGAAVAGAAVFRFQDGSLLNVNLTGGSDCIDFTLGQALCIRIFTVTGGSGRFKNASGGPITLTMIVSPVAVDASKNPVFFSVTGSIAGMFPVFVADQ